MKIKKVTYKQSRKIEDDWHAIRVEAELSSREKPAQAVEKLKEIVDEELDKLYPAHSDGHDWYY